MPGCPVCRVTNKAVGRYLDKIFYTKVNDRSLRAKLRVSLGFCRQHAYLLLDAHLADALGMSIIYQDVLKNMLADLPKEGVLPSQNGLRHSLRQLASRFQAYRDAVLKSLRPKGSCIACEQQELTLGTVVMTLVDSL